MSYLQDGTTHILDLNTRHGMSDCEYIKYEENNKTKTKVLFRNIELDDFFFENVAQGNISVKAYYKKYNLRAE